MTDLLCIYSVVCIYVRELTIDFLGFQDVYYAAFSISCHVNHVLCLRLANMSFVMSIQSKLNS